MQKRSKYYNKLIEGYSQLTNGDKEAAKVLLKKSTDLFMKNQMLEIKGFDEFLEMGEKMGFSIDNQIETMVEVVRVMEKINVEQN